MEINTCRTTWPDLLVATGNPGKAREIRQLLQGVTVRILSLGDFAPLAECIEDGSSFLENAMKKAHHYFLLTGIPTLADDSGLCVQALGGRPGIHSARYAGPNASDAARIQKLLSEMRQVPDEERLAFFSCALCLYEKEGPAFLKEERTEGRILHQPSGGQGFGYDPIFYIPEYRATYAELPSEIKNQISHRGKVFHAFRDYLLEKRRFGEYH